MFGPKHFGDGKRNDQLFYVFRPGFYILFSISSAVFKDLHLTFNQAVEALQEEVLMFF